MDKKIEEIEWKELLFRQSQFSSSYLCLDNFMICGLITHNS